jgi:uracil-DNA glycosylase family 4
MKSLLESRIDLKDEIAHCRKCASSLPLGPRPVFRISPHARVLIVGQAPGKKVHQTGIPWNDPSGRRLRAWMGVSRQDFYDENLVAIAPMGFCYPGKGERGDLPPRPECAPLWMERVVHYVNPSFILLIGHYAQKYFLKERAQANVTETVKAWQSHLPRYFVLPHPSPRNNLWLRKNLWFEEEVIPALRLQVHRALKG